MLASNWMGPNVDGRESWDDVLWHSEHKLFNEKFSLKRWILKKTNRKLEQNAKMTFANFHCRHLNRTQNILIEFTLHNACTHTQSIRVPQIRECDIILNIPCRVNQWFDCHQIISIQFEVAMDSAAQMNLNNLENRFRAYNVLYAHITDNTVRETIVLHVAILVCSSPFLSLLFSLPSSLAHTGTTRNSTRVASLVVVDSRFSFSRWIIRTCPKSSWINRIEREREH